MKTLFLTFWFQKGQESKMFPNPDIESLCRPNKSDQAEQIQV